MDTSWKNCLQEYCQKKKISLPNYRIINQSGPSHILKFQAEIQVDGHCYVGDDLCSSKKEAEQSAARKAWEALSPANSSSVPDPPSTEDHSEPPPPYSAAVNDNTIHHLPAEHADIEQFISNKVEACGGRIRKIWKPYSQGRYKLDITGSYRYCENIKRHHKKNQIYFIIDPVHRTYFQKCYDPECYGFQSAIKNIDNERRTLTTSEENSSTSEYSSCR